MYHPFSSVHMFLFSCTTFSDFSLQVVLTKLRGPRVNKSSPSPQNQNHSNLFTGCAIADEGWHVGQEVPE